MKKRVIVTSLLMASVLPFIGGIETVRADESTNLIAKTKSDLELAKERLSDLQNQRANLEKQLGQAKKDASRIQEEIQQDKDKLAIVEDNIKKNEEIIEKDKRIQEINSEIDALAKKMINAENEVQIAHENFMKAEKAYKEAKDQSSDGEKFIPKDKSEDLRKEYEIADELLTTNKKNQAKIQDEYNKNLQERNDLARKKEGIKDFFEDYAKDNSGKINSPEYKDFQKKQDQTYKKIDEEIEQKKKQAGLINNSLTSIAENVKENQKTRDDKLKAYEKHQQALAIQKDYEEKKIKDLDAFEQEKHKELQQAEQKLSDAKDKTNKVLGQYQSLLIKEAEKKIELSRSKAADKFLEEILAANEDDFVKNNADSLRKAQAIYKQKASATEKSLQLIQTDMKVKSDELKDLNIEQSNEQEDYDKKKNSLEIIKELKEFIENKKQSKTKDERLNELEKVMNIAKAKLEEKRAAVAEISKKDDELSENKTKLGGDVDPTVLQTAKTQLEKDRADVEKIKAHIKELEKSEDLAKLKTLEGEIKALDQNIEKLKAQIDFMKKVKDNKPSDNKKPEKAPEKTPEKAPEKAPENHPEKGNENRPQLKPENKPENKEKDKKDTPNSPSDKEESNDDLIDYSNLKSDKIKEKIRLRNSYTRLKVTVKKSKKIVSLAEEYAKTKKMSAKKRRELLKLIEELKEILRLVEKYMEKLALSL